MSMLDKFRKGAQKATIQASAFVKEGSHRVATGSQTFVQGFSLPGEADKAAKILESFLGASHCKNIIVSQLWSTSYLRLADPDRPESALNSIPKAVLQRARGVSLSGSSS